MTQGLPSNHGRAGSARYTLVDQLGAGGQAEVWRARDNQSGIEVALKVLNPSLAHDESAWSALTREHAIASRLDYPSILKVYPPYREGDFVALPMELASGGDLRRLRGKSYLEVIPVLIDIAQALEYAHERGVIHRDLKPSNVLFDFRGRVRIADFGIAGAPGEVNRAIVRPGLSPFTASPEHLRGDPPAISDDIYGLGALAYELLSGYPPYYPRFDVKRALDEPVPDIKPAQLMPHQLANTIMRMLSKRASLRPRSMRDVIDEFDSALNDTLTFEFDAQEPSDGTPASMRRDAAVLAAAEAAKRSAAPPPAPASPPQTRIEVGTFEPGARTKSKGSEHAEPARAPEESVRVTGAMAKRSAPASKRGSPRPASAPKAEPAPRAESPPSRPAARTDADHARSAPRVETDHARPVPRVEAESARPVPPTLTAAPPIHRAERSEPRVERPAPRFEQRAEPRIEDDVHEDDHVVVDPLNPAVAGTIEGERIAAAAAAVRDVAPDLQPPSSSSPGYWQDVPLPPPLFRRRAPPPPPRSSWPWVLLTTLVAAAAVVFFVFPQYGDELRNLLDRTKAATAESNPSSVLGATPAEASASADPKWNDAAPGPAVEATDPAVAKVSVGADSVPVVEKATAAPASRPEKPAQPEAASQEAIAQKRANFEQRLASLESRGAGFWGGPDFAAAKTRAAEAVGANDAGSPQLADKRLNEALRLLALVESRATQALNAQLTAGDNALADGQPEVAKQAYESARRIDSNNRRAQDGLQRVRSLSGVLPLLADGENAEAAKDYARAVQDYSQALSLDPNNAKAKAGLDRAHAAFGNDTYAKAVGTGFAALGAGRLEDARIAFEKARSMRPGGAEAQTGLARVGAALRARGFASTRQRAAGLEAEERWSEAAAEYDAALNVDPSLVFAQQGRARAVSRAELSENLQALIDRPERLASPAVRSEADTLIKRAAGQDPSGPVLRSQIARLQILLPGFDVPVRLEMVSDNATQVQIQRVGTFGTFSKREIELKPGKYTVVGTRPGFRDVRRDVTIAPGDNVQTINVSCVEPI